MRKAYLLIAITVMVIISMSGCARIIRESSQKIICFGLMPELHEIEFKTYGNSQWAKVIVDGETITKLRIINGQLYQYCWDQGSWELQTPPDKYKDSYFTRFEATELGIIIVDNDKNKFILIQQ